MEIDTTQSDDEDTHRELKAALEGLSYQSESDFPLEFVCFPKLSDRELDSVQVCSMLGMSQDTRVEETDALEFLQERAKVEDWFEPDERINAQGFDRLKQIIERKLEKLRLFRIGQIQILVLLLGDDGKSYLGFKTFSIET